MESLHQSSEPRFCAFFPGNVSSYFEMEYGDLEQEYSQQSNKTDYYIVDLDYLEVLSQNNSDLHKAWLNEWRKLMFLKRPPDVIKDWYRNLVEMYEPRVVDWADVHQTICTLHGTRRQTSISWKQFGMSEFVQLLQASVYIMVQLLQANMRRISWSNNWTMIYASYSPVTIGLQLLQASVRCISWSNCYRRV